MKVKDITVDSVVDYLRLSDGEYDAPELQAMLAAAKRYVCEYTGRDMAWVNDRDDLWAVVMVLVQDLHDNRSLYVTGTQEKNVNRMIWSALSMHSVNLL